MRKQMLLALAGSALSLAGCGGRLPVNLLAPTPQEVATFAGVELSAAAAARGAQVWVASGTTTQAQRDAMRQAVLVVQREAKALRAARDAGRPLAFTAFNRAVRAFVDLRDGSAAP